MIRVNRPILPASPIIGLACTLAVLGFLSRTAAAGSPEFPATTYRVPRERIVEAMRRESLKGYELRAVSQATRLNTGTILGLVRDMALERPDGPWLLLHYDDWYEAYRQVTGLRPDSIPDFIALQRDYRQSQYVDYNALRTRIEVKEGPQPKRVVHVLAGWPEADGAAAEYTFVDSSRSPRMRATNERYISYWLLEYADMIIQDQIQGVEGRPLDGALGAMFSLIGDGRALQSRFAVSADGLLVTYSIAKKGIFKVKPTSTTSPDGTVTNGVPGDREDLKAIEKRLKRKIEIEYSGGP